MTVHDKLYQMSGLANELAHDWEAEGNRDAAEFKQLWPFSVDNAAAGGGLSIDEWAAEVQALADEYVTSAEVDTTAPGWINPDPDEAGPIEQAHVDADRHAQTCDDPGCAECNPTARGMLASELIAHLIPIRDNHGDPLVTIYAHQWFQHVGAVTLPDETHFTAVLYLGDELDPREG